MPIKAYFNPVETTAVAAEGLSMGQEAHIIISSSSTIIIVVIVAIIKIHEKCRKIRAHSYESFR